MDVWYKSGLRFNCTGCGGCCTGPSGYVWISNEEIDRIAAFLNIDRALFLRQYTRRIGQRYALTERRRQGLFDCVFLEEKRCRIYPVRPSQCRTFPWWQENLTSRESWQEAARQCEGIDHPDALLIPLEEIERNRSER